MMMRINFVKRFLILFLFLFISSCSSTYQSIDCNVNKLTAPVTLISRSVPDIYGNRVYKVRDGEGKTYTSKDNSLSSVIPGTVIIPSAVQSYKKIDDELMDMKSPVIVIGKCGKIIKLRDRKNKIITVDDVTLQGYNIGDIIK